MARRQLSHPDRAARFSFEGAAIRLSADPAAAPRFLANASWRHVLDTAPLRALIAWAAEDPQSLEPPKVGDTGVPLSWDRGWSELFDRWPDDGPLGGRSNGAGLGAGLGGPAPNREPGPGPPARGW